MQREVTASVGCCAGTDWPPHLSHRALRPSRRCSCTVRSVCHTGRHSHIHTAAGSRPRTSRRHTLCTHTAACTNTRDRKQIHHDANHTRQGKNLYCRISAEGCNMGFFSLFPPIIYGWTQCGVGSRRWQPQSLEGEDIPATGLKVSRSRRGGRAWHSATGEGCNRHRGRIVCDAELRGRTSRNVIAGSTETFTGQASVWWRDEFCQQITRLWAKTNELRLQAELRLMDFPSSTVKQPQSSVLNVYCRVQVMLFFCISVQTNQHHYGFARRG